MRVAVTGGAGFIGSHIVEMLIEQGDDVEVVDNFSTGDPNHVHRQASVVELDVVSKSLEQVFQQFKPEVVIHQAAQVDVPKSLADPLSDGMANVMGTLNVLEAARRSGVRKVVYASSCAVYGEPQSAKISEFHPPEPISLYGASKWLGESYVRLYHRLFQLDYTILRYSNVYGPRQGMKGEGGVVSSFIHNLLAGVPPVIYGDGKQTRDFVYVKDVARANLLAVKWASTQVLNISTGVQTSIETLCDQLISRTDHVLKADYKPARPGDIRHSCLDPFRAEMHLGWEAAYTLAEGLDETIQYARERR
ncbi:NAD-dependent epimerase/dehydratase family protein [Brevibacillus humidisoli]|uniref:NAD-dependent epimerase/dehydratase family protein n=1 Tax=Brevibacillus humidisoli TaxID=2895522 RepID=UPI001E3AD7D2|nr:NAD-dependent epimerase/dehydratase family protein [Brevibacillus humidisoli]UFJ41953.1 NAD-dependent epimerase/dehydratase family protein [Brevibacillus humidisoli]